MILLGLFFLKSPRPGLEEERGGWEKAGRGGGGGGRERERKREREKERERARERERVRGREGERERKSEWEKEREKEKECERGKVSYVPWKGRGRRLVELTGGYYSGGDSQGLPV